MDQTRGTDPLVPFDYIKIALKGIAAIPTGHVEPVQLGRYQFPINPDTPFYFEKSYGIDISGDQVEYIMQEGILSLIDICTLQAKDLNEGYKATMYNYIMPPVMAPATHFMKPSTGCYMWMVKGDGFLRVDYYMRVYMLMGDSFLDSHLDSPAPG